MSNRLNEDLTGRVVVIDARALRAEYGALRERLFRAEDGFGCSPATIGSAVFGTYLADGMRARIDGGDVERFATEEDMREVEEAAT